MGNFFSAEKSFGLAISCGTEGVSLQALLKFFRVMHMNNLIVFIQEKIHISVKP